MTATCPTDAPTTSTSRTALWIPVSLAMFTAAWGGNEFTPLLVMYRQDGGLSPVAVDGLLFTYVLGIIPALLLGGPLSDRYGRRPLMLPAPILAGLGQGQEITITGISADSTWYQLSDGSWVFAELVDNPPANMPVVEAPPLTAAPVEAAPVEAAPAEAAPVTP